MGHKSTEGDILRLTVEGNISHSTIHKMYKYQGIWITEDGDIASLIAVM